MSKVNNSSIIWAILVSLTLSVVAILIPTAAFADSGENIFSYLFGQLYGNEYDARIPYEDYNNNGEIRFNDKWLTQDTTQYNNALSSFCANCSEKIEQDKDSINNYLKENNLGVAYFGGDEKPNGWSGFYCISHKIVEVDGKQSVVLFICCRGTQRLSEVIGDYFRGNNVNFLNSQIYDNVYDFEENVYEGLISYSENHYIDENHFVKLKDIMSDNLKVIVTGHSLGGAAANAVAAKLNYEAGSDNWWLHKIQKSDVCAYTYGAIKVLGDNYNDETNLEEGYENIHNVYNWSDSFGPYGSKQHLRVSVPNKKFGHTETFDIDKHDFGLWPFFPFETTYTASHNMSTYIEAINNEAIKNKKNNHYLDLYCFNDVYGDLYKDVLYQYMCAKTYMEAALKQNGNSRAYSKEQICMSVSKRIQTAYNLIPETCSSVPMYYTQSDINNDGISDFIVRSNYSTIATYTIDKTSNIIKQISWYGDINSLSWIILKSADLHKQFSGVLKIQTAIDRHSDPTAKGFVLKGEKEETARSNAPLTDSIIVAVDLDDEQWEVCGQGGSDIRNRNFFSIFIGDEKEIINKFWRYNNKHVKISVNMLYANRPGGLTGYGCDLHCDDVEIVSEGQ